MGVVTARLLFLAFLALTATIIYNALYLQAHGSHGLAVVPAAGSAGGGAAEIVSVAPRNGANENQSAAMTVYAKTPRTDSPTSPVVTDMPSEVPASSESLLIVRAVQRELAMRGYDVGSVDGRLSDKTRAAISSFQTSEGLVATGIPSDDLLRQILLGDSIASSGTTGSVAASDSIAVNVAERGAVIRVQQVLAELGYAPGPIDGAWGEKTASAVMAFQRDRGLPETGTITPELLAEFQRVTGRDSTKTAARP